MRGGCWVIPVWVCARSRWAEGASRVQGHTLTALLLPTAACVPTVCEDSPTVLSVVASLVCGLPPWQLAGSC